MNQEFMDKLNYIRTKKNEDGISGPFFDIGPNVGGIIKIYFRGYVDGRILYEILEFAHIDGFSHRGGKTTMEIEEKWSEENDTT